VIRTLKRRRVKKFNISELRKIKTWLLDAWFQGAGQAHDSDNMEKVI